VRGLFVPDRRRFYRPQSELDLKWCRGCGGSRPVGEFVTDASKPDGLGSLCRPCDRERSRSYCSVNRVAVRARAAARKQPALPRACSECGDILEGRRRVVCSERCREARFRRLHPKAYAEREAAKVVRRRERRREESSLQREDSKARAA